MEGGMLKSIEIKLQGQERMELEFLQLLFMGS